MLPFLAPEGNSDRDQIPKEQTTAPHPAERIQGILTVENIFPDYTENVRELAADKNKLWESSDPADFQPNGKINFLHLDDDGVFTLTIIKPGTKTPITTQIDTIDVAAVRSALQGSMVWDKTRSPETWTDKKGDVPLSIYYFNRTLVLPDERVLRWAGNHKNQQNGTITITDTLGIE
ncbi:hypothetical protein KBB89_02780 [Candidatus Gracilibacteria bacterium]|nr:hypothetical protein [Candidatus Gracilibacteria bacterium]